MTEAHLPGYGTVGLGLYPGIRPAWHRKANCRDLNPALFYPERGESVSEAKEVCRACTVRPDCLEYDLANGEKFGIWGGLSERERRIARRERRDQQKEAS